MSLKIYNSLTKKKEEFVPLVPNKVGMYVCGPTVYGPAHVGHARTYVNFDTVRRYLTFCGYNVKYVSNITDVGHLVGDGDSGEDKISKQAAKEQLDPYAIAYKYENMFFDCMDKLNVMRPTISSRATGFIPEIINMVKTLIDKGYAYVTGAGNVYFRVRDFKNYGLLSGRSLNDAKSGERIEIAGDKHSPEDFALWKSAEGGHIMRWDSPWGVGYPGWHIECSVMSKKFLGDTLDIHGGGIDNMFPHHECEIAQSEAANGKPFVRFFMHNNLITVNGTKMGKSLGNFITLDDLFKKFSPMAVRYFILNYNYRSPVDFNEAEIERANAQLEKITSAYKAVCKAAENKLKNEKTDVLNKCVKSLEYSQFIKAMDDDFNTPLAISYLLQFIKFAKNCTESLNGLMYINQLKKEFDDMLYILGLNLQIGQDQQESKSGNTNADSLVKLLGEIRTKLREQKNYQLSDYIRDKLTELGITSADGKLQ